MKPNRLKFAGIFLILASACFWISWFLIPDPGTTNARHILQIISEARSTVLVSVTFQIISSVLYILAILLLAQAGIHFKRTTLAGAILLTIGVMGSCADSFFHLLAYFMTGTPGAIPENMIALMHQMQTDALLFLIPVFIPFFLGSLPFTLGLQKQNLISKTPYFLILSVCVLAIVNALVSKWYPAGKGPYFALSLLGLLVLAHMLAGRDLIKYKSQYAKQHASLDNYK